MKLLNIGLMVDGKNVGLARDLKEQSTFYQELNGGDINRRIMDMIQEHDFDLAFFQIQAANVVSPEVIKQMKAKGIFTINWMGDIRRTLEPWFIEFGADLTCFSNMRDIETMINAGHKADFLQIGIDPQIFTKQAEPFYKYDVVFMGNHYGYQFPLGAERYALVQWLKSRRYAVFGSYPGADGNLMHSQVEEAEVYNQTKIGINHSHFNVDRYTSDRMFRILGSGTFCLSHHYQGIENDFEIGVELDTYHSVAEMEKKIRYYLDHPKERIDIAARGFQLCQAKHTYKQMAENIFNLYKKHK